MTDETPPEPTEEAQVTAEDAPEVGLLTVTGTGTPATSPNFGAPRYSANDAADYPNQTNAVTDAFDAQAARRGAIVDADIAAGAAVQESKLNLATDAAPGTGSRRTLGQGAQQAAPGNDARFFAPGDIKLSAATAQSGWLVCDGSAVSRATYNALFAAIGTSFGAGDGSTTFNLPDLRGRVPVGSGAGTGLSSRAMGAQGGEENHLLAVAEMPAHAHPLSDPGHAHSVYDPGHAHNASSGSTSSTGGWWVPNIQNYVSNPNAGMPSANSSYNWGPYSSGQGWSLTQLNHSHSVSVAGSGTGIGIYAAGTGITMGNNGGGNSHPNMQPFTVVAYLIKT